MVKGIGLGYRLGLGIGLVGFFTFKQWQRGEILGGTSGENVLLPKAPVVHYFIDKRYGVLVLQISWCRVLSYSMIFLLACMQMRSYIMEVICKSCANEIRLK